MKYIVLVGSDLTIENTNTNPKNLIEKFNTFGEYARFLANFDTKNFLYVKSSVTLGCVADCKDESDWFNFKQCRYYNFADVFTTLNNNRVTSNFGVKIYIDSEKDSLDSKTKSSISDINELYGSRHPAIPQPVTSTLVKSKTLWKTILTLASLKVKWLLRID